MKLPIRIYVMKLKYHVLIMSVLFWLVACAPTIKAPPISDKTAKAEALFKQAEKLFNVKAYTDALKVFEEYLVKYPDQPLADAALMKMASIYGALGRDEAKLNVYQRLVKEYPKSRFVPDAMLEILSTYFHEGRYKDVILQAADILERTNSKQHIFQTYVYLADTYIAMDAPKDAVYFINIAYHKAPSNGKGAYSCQTEICHKPAKNRRHFVPIDANG